MTRVPSNDKAFPWKALARPLTRDARARVAAQTQALLAWQRRLVRWPRVGSAPDATPFVTLYAGGRLVGCFGSMEGTPGERLARAFVSAAGDGRYDGIAANERDAVAACVSYLRNPICRALGELERRFELGTHGVAAVVPGKTSALLLPSVAVDEHADLSGLLVILARKMGVDPSELARASLYMFEAESVVARQSGPPDARSRPPHRGAGSVDAIDSAATWLARQIDSKGRVRFGVDARARAEHPRGEFLHGRAAVLVQALAAHGGHPREAARARRWLGGEVRAALAGRNISDWPRERAAVAGTVALAVMAGVDLADELTKLAATEDVKQNAWHAAQVVAALGRRAPPTLFEHCVAHLREQPWAPWTAIAADVWGDTGVRDRACDALAASVRTQAPYFGAVNVTRIPETALVAVAVEALARSPTRAARAAARSATSFLSSVQLLGERIPASLDPDRTQGAFPLSLVLDGLRADVTAHALLALLAMRPRVSVPETKR